MGWTPSQWQIGILDKDKGSDRMAKDWSIERYSPAEAREWDEFVDRSRCATFLFKRPYMDYHAERFRDCSWIVRKGNAIVAMLPANIDEEGILHSHQGLTYGGWILPESHIDGADLLDIQKLVVTKPLKRVLPLLKKKMSIVITTNYNATRH